MSMISDIKSILTEKYVRKGLSLEERTKLFIDITNVLEWYEYDEFNNEDYKRAMNELCKYDEENEKNENKKEE